MYISRRPFHGGGRNRTPQILINQCVQTEAPLFQAAVFVCLAAEKVGFGFEFDYFVVGEGDCEPAPDLRMVRVIHKVRLCLHEHSVRCEVRVEGRLPGAEVLVDFLGDVVCVAKIERTNAKAR